MHTGQRRRPVIPGGAVALALIAALWAGAGPASASGPPIVSAEWASSVGSNSARLSAQIDPNGSFVTYHFEYLTEAAYQANGGGFAGALRSPTSSEAVLGLSPGTGSRSLTNLATATTYRYRVVAQNSDPGSPTNGPVHSFTTPPSGAGSLLDNRGWEMVSPIDKNGGQVDPPGTIAGGGVLQAAADGNSATYGSTASFGEGAGGAPPASQYLATRTAAGWATQNISTPPIFSGSYDTSDEGVPYQLFSGDLARGLLLNGDHCRGGASGCAVANPPLAGTDAPEGYQDYYLRDGGAGSFTALLGAADVSSLDLGPAYFDLRFAGASPDLSHAVLSSCAALTADANEVTAGSGCDPNEQNLYEWSSGSGLAPTAINGGTPGAALAAQSSAVSTGGDRVYWNDTATGDLHLHDASGDHLVGSASDFQAATPDGATAFYTTASGDLHAYDAASHASGAALASGLEPRARHNEGSFTTVANPSSVAVDDATGDVYVADQNNGYVYRYDSQGNPKDFTCAPGPGCDASANNLHAAGFFFAVPGAVEIAVDQSSGRIYVTDYSDVMVFDQSGQLIATLNGGSTPNSSYGIACGVAVDQSTGDVYVGDANDSASGIVWRYTPSGGTIAESDYSGAVGAVAPICNVAAAQGHVYASETADLGDGNAGVVYGFSDSDFQNPGPNASPTTTMIGTGAMALAADPTRADAYIDTGSEVDVADSTGTPLYSFGSGDFSGSTGVAVRGFGAAYAGDGGSNVVDVYSPALVGVLGISDSGDTAYFQDSSGLERWHNGVTTQVAPGANATAPSDYPPTTGTARVSADGNQLLFLSKASLTGYDNTDLISSKPDSEVFLYDAGASPALRCVSCNPTGERPIGPSTIPGAVANGTAPGSTDSYKPRALSADGKRVFFDTSDALVLTDTNTVGLSGVGIPDVYEWEAGGEGSCAAAGGCLALVSSGRSAAGASFVDASADGSNAFFLTGSSLVSTDPGALDLYDARAGGGFPVPSPPISCEGDACPTIPSPPTDPTITTLLSGHGNPAVHYYNLNKKKSKRCKRGFVKRHNRCVKRKHRRKHKKAHHKRKAKRHHKRGRRR